MLPKEYSRDLCEDDKLRQKIIESVILFSSNPVAAVSLLAQFCDTISIDHDLMTADIEQWWKNTTATKNEVKRLATMMASARDHIFESIRTYPTASAEQTDQAFCEYDQARKLLEELATTKREITSNDIALIQKGIQARQFLILANMKLVTFFSNRYSRDNYYFEDTLQEGMLGLIATIEKFDRLKEASLSTYAAFWIRRFMSRSISDETLIRIPLYLSVALNISKKQEALGVDTPPVSESRSSLMQHAQQLMEPVDFDEKLGVDQHAEKLISDKQNFVDELDTRWLNEDLQDIFEEVLTAKEELIIKLLYGIDTPQRLTQHQIAQRMGCSPQRIQQLSKSARQKIADYFSHQGITDYRKFFEVI